MSGVGALRSPGTCDSWSLDSVHYFMSNEVMTSGEIHEGFALKRRTAATEGLRLAPNVVIVG